MNDMILILNYSDEFAVEAAKRLRGERVFCKIMLAHKPAKLVIELIQFQGDRLGHHMGKQGAAILQDLISIRAVYQEGDPYCLPPD